MAGLAPFFITGANAKVKVNGVTLAFCTDLTYSVEVTHASPTVLGMYEASSLEPLAYKVSGSFTIVRYANNVKENLENNGFKTPNGVNPDGNGIGNFTDGRSSSLGDIISRTGAFGNDGRAHEAFDPSRLQNATFFDIEVYQKMPGGEDVRGVARLRSCRLNRADAGLNKKSALVQRFTFQAIYLDEDSFIADFSGSGQQFQ